MKLEQLAREAFEQYAYSQTNVTACWDYLSPSRQLRWIEELVEQYKMVITNTILTIRPAVSIGTGGTSFEKGFLHGQGHENRRVTALLEHMLWELDQQVVEWKQRNYRQE